MLRARRGRGTRRDYIFVDQHIWPAVAGFGIRKEHTFPVHFPVQMVIDPGDMTSQVYTALNPLALWPMLEICHGRNFGKGLSHT